MPGTKKTEPAAEVKAEALCDIFCLCYPQFRMSAERFGSLMINGSVDVITHCEGDELVGFALVERSALRLICVKPKFQRRGIGSLMLEKAESLAAKKGHEKLLIGGVSSKFLIGADKRTSEFFEKNGFYSVGGCDELLLRLESFEFDEKSFRGHEYAEYGWYGGSTAALHRAVSEVNESWVKFFDCGSRVYTATVGGEIASFCIVSTDNVNYLTDAFGRVGMPGCVGTVPRYRDRGIAIEMVARVTQYLKDSGMDISFIFFTGIADWYKKLGYEVFMTEVFMEKEIQPN